MGRSNGSGAPSPMRVCSLCGASQVRLEFARRSASDDGIAGYSLMRDAHWPNRAVGSELEPIDAHHAVVAIRPLQRAPMIHDVPLPRTRRLHDRVMAGASRDVGIL